MANKKVNVELLGRDRVEAEFVLRENGLPSASLAEVVDFDYRASGCSLFLNRLHQFKKDLLALSPSERAQVFSSFDSSLSVSVVHFLKSLAGNDHVSILLRELVLKVQNQFQLPYQEQELCHCRAISTEFVDRAVVGGCHTTVAVARSTSAGTSCGTCKTDTEKLIQYRLKPLI